MTDNIEAPPEAVLAFISSLAHINLNAPTGVNAGQFHAKRLREIRNAARHILNQQYGDLERVIASMMNKGEIAYRSPDQFTIAGKSKSESVQ